MSNVNPSPICAPDEEDIVAGYRPLSTASVIGLVVGCLSCLAFSHPVLWTLPPVALLVNLFALKHIAHEEPPLAGRRLALAGIALALICGISAPVQERLARWHLRTQAMQTTRQWFEALRDNRPEVAYQLTLPPGNRWPLDDELRGRYDGPSKVRLEEYATNSAVRLLLKLGPRAQVRYYFSALVRTTGLDAGESDFYAVTVHDDSGLPTTFFVKLRLNLYDNLVTDKQEMTVSHVDFLTQSPEDWLASR